MSGSGFGPHNAQPDGHGNFYCTYGCGAQGALPFDPRTCESNIIQAPAAPAAECYTVNAIVHHCLHMKGTRKHVYYEANKYYGYSEGDIPVAVYTESGDMVIHVVFKTERDAQSFEDSVRDFMRAPFNLTVNVEAASPGGSCSQRILREDYISQDTDSPDVTETSDMSYSSAGVPSDDLLRFQSIETWMWLECSEKAHIFGLKEGASDVEKKDGNNLLALSRDVHGYLDGLGSLKYPWIRISAGEPTGSNADDDKRFNIPLIVECLNLNAARIFDGRLKAGAVQSLNDAGRPEFVVSVAVVDPDAFRGYVQRKHDATTEIWRSKRLI